MFIVLSSGSLSLTERNILALIEGNMSERGYQKANSFESANVGVVYKYSIDPAGSVHSYPGYAVGGHGTYATHLQKSKPPEKIEVVWQGELYSVGTSRNIALLAPYFIDVLFENFGTTVTNKSFLKIMD